MADITPNPVITQWSRQMIEQNLPRYAKLYAEWQMHLQRVREAELRGRPPPAPDSYLNYEFHQLQDKMYDWGFLRQDPRSGELVPFFTRDRYIQDDLKTAWNTAMQPYQEQQQAAALSAAVSDAQSAYVQAQRAGLSPPLPTDPRVANSAEWQDWLNRRTEMQTQQPPAQQPPVQQPPAQQASQAGDPYAGYTQMYDPMFMNPYMFGAMPNFSPGVGYYQPQGATHGGSSAADQAALAAQASYGNQYAAYQQPVLNIPLDFLYGQATGNGEQVNGQVSGKGAPAPVYNIYTTPQQSSVPWGDIYSQVSTSLGSKGGQAAPPKPVGSGTYSRYLPPDRPAPAQPATSGKGGAVGGGKGSGKGGSL